MLSHSKFILVGPPGMGKSTLISLIPSVISQATAIDLECLVEDNNTVLLHSLAKQLGELAWQGPLFLGCGGAHSPELAGYGYTVIALFHDNHQNYMDWMYARDARDQEIEHQDDYWLSSKILFEQLEVTIGERFYRIDPIADFPSKKIELIKHLAAKFSLPLVRNPPGEPVD